MNVYRVEITRTEYQSATIEVEAENEEEAEEIAGSESVSDDFETINADEFYTVHLLRPAGEDAGEAKQDHGV